jgi:hypothetical protein
MNNDPPHRPMLSRAGYNYAPVALDFCCPGHQQILKIRLVEGYYFLMCRRPACHDLKTA